jgi:hypothetical protein
VAGESGARRTIRSSSATLEKAGAAVNGTPLRRIKRNRGLLTTLRTLHRDLNALPDTGCLGRGDGGQSFVLRLLTGLATLWLVLQTLIMEKGLLTRCPDEILVAVYAFDAAIWMFGIGGCFHLADFFPF